MVINVLIDSRIAIYPDDLLKLHHLCLSAEEALIPDSLKIPASHIKLTNNPIGQGTVIHNKTLTNSITLD